MDQEIDKAVDKLRPSPARGQQPQAMDPGKVIAQLMAGAWAGRLEVGGRRGDGTAADYEHDLWDPALGSAFQVGPSRLSRSQPVRWPSA